MQVDWNGSAIPPDVSDWTGAIVVPLTELSEFYKPSDARQQYTPGLDRLIELAKSPTALLLRKKGLDNRTGRLNVVIHNNTNQTVSDLRLRVGDFRSFWRVFLTGEFLTAKEADDFYQRVGEQSEFASVVLPDLPSLPANGILVVSVYGDGEFANVQLAAPGHTFRMTKTTKIPNSWLLEPVEHPFVIGVPILWFLVLGFQPLWTWLKRRAVLQVLPSALYDFGCEAARSGNSSAAINFLTKAFEIGFANKNQARNDPDLISLHKLPEFKVLTEQ